MPALARGARRQRRRRRLPRYATRDIPGAWRLRRSRPSDRAQRHRSGAEIAVERAQGSVHAAYHIAAFRSENARARSSRSGESGAQSRRAQAADRTLGRRLDRGAEPQPVLAPGDLALPALIDAVGSAAVASHPYLRLAQPVAPRSRRRAVRGSAEYVLWIADLDDFDRLDAGGRAQLDDVALLRFHQCAGDR